VNPPGLFIIVASVSGSGRSWWPNKSPIQVHASGLCLWPSIGAMRNVSGRVHTGMEISPALITKSSITDGVKTTPPPLAERCPGPGTQTFEVLVIGVVFLREAFACEPQEPGKVPKRRVPPTVSHRP
jgi:hypothetical protein